MNITKSAAVLVAGVAAALTVACSSTGTAVPGGSGTPSRASESSTEPVVSTSSSSSETGTIVVHVSDLQGTGLGDIEVNAYRVGPCDPSHFEMPAVDGYVETVQDHTDRSGTVVLEHVTLGCWSVAATVPTGFSRVDATRTSIFLVDGGDTAEANLKIERGMTDPCGGDALANAMDADTIDIKYCTEPWALVSETCGPDDSCENGPGDNTRILRIQGDRWVTYTALPSTMCLSTAKNDGVPADLQKNFNPNC